MREVCFIPRDAGFFSVFNFYVGTLCSGLNAYPYFNKEELLSRYRKNEHFAYWTENENCWFDYFEPVKFFDSDTNHEEKYKSFPRINGENIADVHFRIPSKIKSLFLSEDKFKEFRENTHKIYSKVISFRKDIIDSIDTSCWISDNIIGVHYRHPSHFVESGAIKLDSYFEAIDKILEKYPQSKIFIASDNNFGIYAFKERYGEALFYLADVDRITMSEFLEWAFNLAQHTADSVGFMNGKGFELHHKRVNNTNNKKMTQDLFREVLCLSKCNQMVHTISNVSLAISYMNPNLELITLV